MSFINNRFKKILLFLLFTHFVFSTPVFASLQDNLELDSLRSEMINIQDKNSIQYLKVKNKFQKIISQNKIDYSMQARFEDIERLIKQQKYDAAVYELSELIDLGYQTSVCHELLGDIYKKNGYDLKLVANEYKTAWENDKDNLSSLFKLSKVYLKAKKNILGLEYLKEVIDLTTDCAVLDEIEYIIQNLVTPKDKYEANILYELLGYVYVKQNKEMESFLALSKALKLNPQDIYLKYFLSDLLLKSNKYSDVINLYDSILKDNTFDSQISYSKALVLSSQGRLVDAYSEYLKILKYYPDLDIVKYEIYKLFKDTLSVDCILQKVYANNEEFNVTYDNCIEFAQLLKNQNDLAGYQEFFKYALTLKPIQNNPQQNKEIKKSLDNDNKNDKTSLSEQNNKIVNQTPVQKIISQDELKLNQTQVAQQKNVFEYSKNELQAVESKNNENILKTKNNKNEKNISDKNIKKETVEKTDDKIQKEKKIKTQKKETKEEKQTEKNNQETLHKAEVKKEDVKKEEILANQNDINKHTSILEEESKKTSKSLDELIEFELNNDVKQDIAILKEEKKAIEKNPKKYAQYEKVVNNYLQTPNKDKQTYIAIANTYKQMGQPLKSLEYFKSALKQDPLDSDIYYNLGLTYMELNSFVSAKTFLTKAIKLDENNTKAVNLLGFINQKLITKILNESYTKYEKKDYVAAFEILDNGIKQYPQNAQLYYYRALVFDGMNRNAAQIIDLQKAIELDRSYYMAYYQLGHAYEKIKDERSALVAYEKFLSTEPDEKDLVKEVQEKVLLLGQKYY